MLHQPTSSSMAVTPPGTCSFHSYFAVLPIYWIYFAFHSMYPETSITNQVIFWWFPFYIMMFGKHDSTIVYFFGFCCTYHIQDCSLVYLLVQFFCIEFFNLPLFAKCSFLFDFFLFCWNIPIFYWNIVDCCMFLSYCWYNFSELLHT